MGRSNFVIEGAAWPEGVQPFVAHARRLRRLFPHDAYRAPSRPFVGPNDRANGGPVVVIQREHGEAFLACRQRGSVRGCASV